MIGTAVEHADAGRTVELVAGEDIEIAADVAHVHVEMHGRLAAVEQHRNAAGMGDAHHLFDRDQCTSDVRHMGDGDEARALGEQRLELVEQKISGIVDRRPLDDGAVALAQKMPGHDVGVMLENREHDLVALPHVLDPERISDEIDRFGCVAGEDDLMGVFRIEEGADFFARALVGLGRGIGEIMQAAVHIGVLGGVGMLEAIEHRLRLLRRGCVVEIDERLAVNRHGEDRKILADAADVIGAVRDGFLHVSPLARRPEVPAEGGVEGGRPVNYVRAASQATT